MRIEDGIKLDFKDVLFKPKRSSLISRSNVELKRKFYFRNCKKTWEGVPIIASNMDTVGTISMARELYKHNMLTCLHKFYSIEDIVSISEEDFFKNCILSMGMNKNDFNKMHNIMSSISDKVNFICIDVANGYTEEFLKYLKKIRARYKDVVLIAGNVVTYEMVEALTLCGVDIIKVGIGSGSACTTRVQTGVGYPQLSAIIECTDAAHGLGVHVISDGGCNVPGDVSKAFGAGADFVMMGGMFAGHDESEGEIIEKDGDKFIKFYGMSSKSAMDKYHGGVANYRSSEGKSVLVKYKGSVDDSVNNILGGVRSSCTYVGAVCLKYLPKCTTFIRCTQQSNEIFGKNT